MRRSWWIGGTVTLALLAGGGAYWRGLVGESAAQASYRLAPVERGAVTAAVRATGTLNPVTTVVVGSQLSGQVVEILVDYNAQVKAGQVVARLASDQIRARREAAAADLAQAEADAAVKAARVLRARASFERARSGLADVQAQGQRATAQLTEARRGLERQTELFERGSGSRVGLDTARTGFDVQRAALASSEAQVASARAELTGLEADIALAEAETKASQAAILGRQAKLRDIDIDLSRTEIRSAVDGVVVQKSVELGQTVAASLSAPVLFQIAQDLREIEIHANVDESDVGRIKAGQRVSFTVNAHPGRAFEGRVRQVRLGAQTIQNVVIYTAVVQVGNADGALLPGMTANVQVVTEERRDVLKVPNAALRWRPAGTPAAREGGPGPAAPSAEEAPRGEPGGQRRRFQELVQVLDAEVKPTPEERREIEAILAETRSTFAAGMAGEQAGGAGREAVRDRAREMRRALGDRIGAVLAPERRALFEAATARLGSDRGQAGAGAVPGRVFVLGAGGEPVPVPVRLGASDGTATEIAAGELTEGQGVVVGGGPRGTAAPVGGAAPPVSRMRMF